MHALPGAPRARIRLRPRPGGIVRLRDGRSALVRRARPADREAVQQFVRELSPLARRRRFFGAVSELSPGQLDRLTRVQDPRDLSLVALSANAGASRIVAMAQYAAADPQPAEFAVVVADAWQRQGLGERLLEMLLAGAAESGMRSMSGSVLAENRPMLALAAKLGFDASGDGHPDSVRVQRPLLPPRPAWFLEPLQRLVTGRPAALTAPALAAPARW
ncbi:MAG TPA: GNAT family N-acetyltransferase [Burkholderiales bacterium]|nr:GNAT family N-acetyltransferase [Burkholderiales bacterium]